MSPIELSWTAKNHFTIVLQPSFCDWRTFFGLSQDEDSKLMILNPYHCIVEMRYFWEMRIYFKAHFALLSDAQYWANTSNALECCNRFTHNGRSNRNLAHKAMLPLKLQYHNPAKSSFVCVSAIHPPSPPERWRSPRIGRQLLEPGRYYGGTLRTTPAPLRTPRTYIGAALRRPPTTPLSVARTYFAGTAPSNALHV